MDDDADCVEHVFELVELHLTVGGTQETRVCTRCGAPAVVTDQEARAARPPLF